MNFEYLVQKLKGLIRFGIVTNAADNNSILPIQQISYNGKAANALVILPYGVHANIPPDLLAVVLAIDGNAGNKGFIPMSLQGRPKDLAVGEIAIYHPQTAAIIHFKNTGAIEVTTHGDFNITADNLNLTGNLNVSGDTALGASVTSDGVNIGSTHTHEGSPTAPDGPQSPTGGPL